MCGTMISFGGMLVELAVDTAECRCNRAVPHTTIALRLGRLIAFAGLHKQCNSFIGNDGLNKHHSVSSSARPQQFPHSQLVSTPK